MSNTEKWTDKNGGTDYMVRVPKFRLCDVIDGASDAVHPAFIVSGKEVEAVYISKYQNAVYNGIPYSLPYQKAAVALTYDKALKLCAGKGDGWHLMSNAEWAAVALWSLKNGTLPHGNTGNGRYHSDDSERGLTSDNCDVLTGSGHPKWSHDHTEDGIYDLCGNVWEMVSGLRTLNGIIQYIPDNNAALNVDMSRDSKEWQNTPYGFAVANDTVKFTTADRAGGGFDTALFKDIAIGTDVPELFKALGLFPTAADDAGRVWVDTNGERVPSRGGRWRGGASSGAFALYLITTRKALATDLGFRAAFVNRAEI